MANHPDTDVDKHFTKLGIAGNFTIANTNVATLTSSVNLTTQQLRELLDGCSQKKYDVKVVAGAVVIFPR